MLQIISQNYVVWNAISLRNASSFLRLQIISQNYVVWNAILFIPSFADFAVTNYITKLRGLKLRKWANF